MLAIEKALIDTCIWFDMFDRPLKKEELFSYLIDQYKKCENITIDNIKNILNSDVLRKVIQEQDDFFFLKSRRAMYDEYSKCSDIRTEKWRYANLYANTFRKIPFIKAIAVCNTLAFDAVHDDSDIDLFIITESGRAWSTRFIATALADIRGWREQDNDAVCLSFFIDENNLDISQYQIDENDTYFKYWIGGLVFVYDSGGVCERFWNANKSYVRDCLSYIKPIVLPDTNPRISADKNLFLKKIDKYKQIIIRRFFCLFPERVLKKIQKKFFITQEVRAAADGKRVVLEDGVLKFHTNDRRKEYNNEFKKRSNEI